MKKYFLTVCVLSAFIPSQAFAANLNLNTAGSLRNALTEVSQDLTQQTGIGVNTVFSPSGIREQAIQTKLAGGFYNPCPFPGHPGGCWIDFTQQTGIRVNTIFSPSGIREQAIQTKLAGGFVNPCPVPGYPGGCWVD